MDEKPPPTRSVSLPIVVARIVLVTGTAFASALAVFLLVGGAWQVGLIALAVTVVLLLLMFLVERIAA